MTIFDDSLKDNIENLSKRNYEILREEIGVFLRYPKTAIKKDENGKIYLVGPKNRITEFERRYFERCWNEGDKK